MIKTISRVWFLVCKRHFTHFQDILLHKISIMNIARHVFQDNILNYLQCSTSDFRLILFGFTISFCVWLILHEVPLPLWHLFAAPCRGEGLLDAPATSIVFFVLQTLQFVSTNGFFKVHFEQDQNSPLRSVMSEEMDKDLSFEPQHASQARECPLFTKVHFLQVHFCSSVGLSPEQ